MIAQIYQDGRRYDRLFGDVDQDLPFWIAQTSRYGHPVLELACGTGRVMLPLAKEGFQVTGVDSSSAMLDEARRKAAQANLSVEWVETDIRTFDLGRTFPLIILPANALCHLLHSRDFEACIASVRRHLAPQGRFIVDVFVPDAARLVDKPGERFPFAEYDDPDGRGKIVITESYVYAPDTQIKHVKTHSAIPGQEEEVEGAFTMRMYFPQELDALLKYNGLAIQHKYGDYDESPFGAESQKQIIVCTLSE